MPEAQAGSAEPGFRVAELTVADRGSGPNAAVALEFAGQLDAEGIGLLWERAMRAARRARRHSLALDLSRVTLVDTAGAAFLIAIEATHGGEVSLQGEQEQFHALLDRVRAAGTTLPPPVKLPPLRLRDIAGAAWRASANGIAFLGEAVLALVRLPRNPRVLRAQDLLNYIDQAGVRSLPLVVLLGFLIGLILAFQSAVPMQRFGADLYVANLVAISLLRELGPLLAAVILAGRTGSAFAAEIGTMKVNQEVDALVTMGLDPMTMLVLPRLIAAMLVMPVMTMVLDIAGLLGMTVVMMAFGFPLVTVANQVVGAVTLTDLFEGLVKALCFGAVVAAIGCREGLGTGVGPRAVGLAATGAVVGGIVSTIVLDGVFALLIFRLGL
ncbi:MAG TPA: ABC transporter permease [Acetobacteraceae bacterium]|nr:ABC transporter permease [Acetobacteraceae bacterium]